MGWRLTHWQVLHFCMEMDLKGDYNPGLFMPTVVFPLAFSVNATFARREAGLRDLSLLKAAAAG